MPAISVTSAAPNSLATDVLIVGVHPDGAALALAVALPEASTTAIQATLTLAAAAGKPEEVTVVGPVEGIGATRVLVVGLGPAHRLTRDRLREAAGAAVRHCGSASAVALALPATDATDVLAIADGAYAASYSFTKVGATAAARERSIVISAAVPVPQASLDQVAVLGESRDLARDLVNTPPNVLTPMQFAHRALDEATGMGVEVEILDADALRAGGFGGIVGVGQGSANPPAIVIVSYRPLAATASVALVGKGITFDSGGLCLKPPASMLAMKSDMAGAAAVLAAVLAVARMEIPVAVTGYLCLAENMPGATAQRPGDVVTMKNGTTVEIIDTDAEGRMVLADGLALATANAPDAVVDIATLTGAQLIALGTRIAAVMANDDDVRGRVLAAAARAGESAWPMPLPGDLRAGLDSHTADLAHKADRNAGMLTAGLFLKQFVPDEIPWAHLDIAGPAFNEKAPWGCTPKGGTGFGVATLVELVQSFAPPAG